MEKEMSYEELIKKVILTELKAIKFGDIPYEVVEDIYDIYLDRDELVSIFDIKEIFIERGLIDA
jgi:hypothetical protein